MTAQLAHTVRLLRSGDALGAIERCNDLLKAYPDRPEILRQLGLGYLQIRKIDQAGDCLSRALAAGEATPDLLNELGIVALLQRRREEALGHFSKALELDGTHQEALSNMASTLSGMKRSGAAQSYLDRLLRAAPLSSSACVRAAENELALGNVEQAITRARKAVWLAPQNSDARLVLAESLEAVGRFKQAKYQYLAVLARDPAHPAALGRLLTSRGTHVDDSYARQASRLLQEAGPDDARRARLHLGLARYHDRGGRYDEAFAHLEAGNAIKSRINPFDSDRFSQLIDKIMETFTAELFRSLPHRDVSTTRPLFIVGMPRSGTTLVEQILASHSGVAAGGELSTIMNLAGLIPKLTGSAGVYPESVETLSEEHLRTMADQYLQRLQRVSPDARRVTDKMPFNFMHLGLICALFPDATILHCSRHPLDTCLSCYFTGFNESLQFSGNLIALGRFYDDYRRLMEHWRSVLPVAILDVEYEQLVARTEHTVRNMLKFCELDWEDACLEFHSTNRGIRTPSHWQVRQPIYDHSIGRWRHYERHLAPLVDHFVTSSGSRHQASKGA